MSTKIYDSKNSKRSLYRYRDRKYTYNIYYCMVITHGHKRLSYDQSALKVMTPSSILSMTASDSTL